MGAATAGMLKQIDFYIGRKVIVPLISTLVLAAMLLLLEKMLKLFDFVVTEGGPVSFVWRMLANLIPEYAGLAVPLGLMMGILLAFRNLALSSELDALRAVGLSYGRLLRVPYIITALLMAANIAIVGFIQPKAEYAYQSLEFELRSGALGASIKVGEFNNMGRGITLRVEGSEDRGRILQGVFVRADSENGARVAVTADRGTFMRTDDPNTILLRLTNGRLVHDQPDFRTPRVLSFASHDLPVSLPAVEGFRRRGVGEQEMTFLEMLPVVTGRAPRDEHYAATAANFHFRVAEVAIMALLPLMAVALAVPPKRSSSGLGMFIGIVFVVAAHKIFQYGERTSSIGISDPFLTIWGPFALMAVLMIWMYWTLAHKPGGQPIGALERVFSKATKFVANLFGAERRRRRQLQAIAAAAE